GAGRRLTPPRGPHRRRPDRGGAPAPSAHRRGGAAEHRRTEPGHEPAAPALGGRGLRGGGSAADPARRGGLAPHLRGIRPGGPHVLNRSRADGARGKRFEELFAELRFTPQAAERWEGTVFADRSEDDNEGIPRRDTHGLTATARWARRWSASLDAERQTASR